MGLEQDGILLTDGGGWQDYGSEKGVGGEGGGEFRVRRLIQDSQGNIWAAAEAQGLRYYDPSRDAWQRQVVLSESEIISDIAEFENGELWVAGQGSDGQGFVAHRPVSSNPSQAVAGGWEEVGPGQELGNDIHGLALAADGKIWVVKDGDDVQPTKDLSHSAHVDPDGDTMNYTVYLLNSDGSANSTLATQITNEYYLWDTTTSTPKVDSWAPY